MAPSAHWQWAGCRHTHKDSTGLLELTTNQNTNTAPICTCCVAQLNEIKHNGKRNPPKTKYNKKDSGSVFGRGWCDRTAVKNCTYTLKRSKGFIGVVTEKKLQVNVCFNHVIHIILYVRLTLFFKQKILQVYKFLLYCTLRSYGQTQHLWSTGTHNTTKTTVHHWIQETPNNLLFWASWCPALTIWFSHFAYFSASGTLNCSLPACLVQVLDR